MKLTTNRFLALLALVLSVILVFFIYFYLQNSELLALNQKTEKDMKRVVVASQNIPAHVVITKEMLEETKYPKDYILPGALMSADEVVGSISKVEIYKGEQVIGERVFMGEQQAGFAYFIPIMKRGVSFAYTPVNCVGGLISPNDRVDVLVTYEPLDTGQSERIPVTSTIVENVEVLALGTNFVREDKRVHENDNGTITLALSPEQAQLVTLAESYGTLKFALRTPVNDKKSNLDPSTITEFR